MITEFL